MCIMYVKAFLVIDSKKENKMKKSIFMIALIAIAGCTAGSHATFGPLHAQSSVTTALELQEPTFVFAEETEDGLCSSSSLFFWNSEVCVDWVECEELSVGAYVNWDQTTTDQAPATE